MTDTDLAEIKLLLLDQAEMMLDMLGKVERLVAAVEVIAQNVPIKMVNDPDSEVQ